MAWPVVLQHGNVKLRPIRYGDERRWTYLRRENSSWLHEWDATSPVPGPIPTFRQTVKIGEREAKAGSALPFAIEYHGEMVGQIVVRNIVYGSLRGAHFGYWIDEAVSGRGIMTCAAALVTDYLIFELNLHRIEIAVRPENEPSNRLARALGYQLEGVRTRFLHINGDWRDHNIWVMTAEALTEPSIARLKRVP